MSGVPDILARIAEATLPRVEERRGRPLPARPREFGAARLGRLAAALKRLSPQAPPRFLCELKRASPSKGVLRDDFDPAAIAGEYARAGADALSVLTEPEFFLGSGDYLTIARRVSKLPCLAKDFFLDPWQIEEAKGLGADGILLIAAMLSDEALRALLDRARAEGLDVLVEVHDDNELDRALRAGADLIGVNHRDLHTFQVDGTLTERLRPRVPEGVTLVSESGISSAQEAIGLARAGVDALLIGEHFMRAERPGEELFRLRRACEKALAGAPSVQVKICGLGRPEDARHAAAAGADYLGIVLCDGPRKRTLEEAQDIIAAARAENPHVPVMAVVRDPDATLARAVLDAGFDGLQLHGSESEPEFALVREWHPTAILWKVVGVRSETDLLRAEGYAHADAVLVEPETRGQGLGVPYGLLEHVAGERRLGVAGGLTPENVAEAVRGARPYLVDVSSGVEKAPGVKDPARVEAFIANAKAAAAKP
ncbi:MAG TPA: indole-3-glycerol phosphate synthase TrpC [Candidatus Eisenbacteria bacterium]|nr:indole-3-glycerol phosphate synthase TrpC [Candidatus Eisenbacteria bacterium]